MSAATYYEIPTINNAIDTLNSTSPEATIRKIWLTILAFTFPPAQGYMFFCENTSVAGDLDVLTTHGVEMTEQDGNNTIMTYKFLVLELYEAQDSTWTEAAGQLQGYLARIHVDGRRLQNNQLPVSYQVYGAIAVGRYVRFYTYNNQTQRIAPVQNYDRYFHIATDSHTVQHLLNYIRDNHT